MTKPNQFDPVAAWQDIVQKWEHEINSWSGKLTESEQFSAMMGQATKASLYAQKAFGEHMEAVLRSLNLPSKVQIEELAERLDAIEESIDRLRLALEPGRPIPEPQRPHPAPRRTRKPAGEGQ